MVWTTEMIERLQALVADGWSASQIAGDLGVSRSAVCGKVHRMAIRVPTKVAVAIPKEKPEVVQFTGVRQGDTQTPFKGPCTLPPYTPRGFRPVVVTNAPEPLHIKLLDLEPGQCRYPHGDRDFTFCGHPQQDGSSYCPGHHAIAIPPREVRR